MKIILKNCKGLPKHSEVTWLIHGNPHCPLGPIAIQQYMLTIAFGFIKDDCKAK
jgi:hypothetical protein